MPASLLHRCVGLRRQTYLGLLHLLDLGPRVTPTYTNLHNLHQLHAGVGVFQLTIDILL